MSLSGSGSPVKTFKMLAPFCGSQTTMQTGSTMYFGLGTDMPGTGERRSYMPFAVKFRNLYVFLDGSPGAGKNYAFTLLVDGNPSALTCTVADAATTGSDVAHEVTVNAGQYVELQAVPTGTPTARRAVCLSEAYYKGAN